MVAGVSAPAVCVSQEVWAASKEERDVTAKDSTRFPSLPTHENLLAVLRLALFPNEQETALMLPAFDWAAVFLEAQQQTVLPLVFEASLMLPKHLQPSASIIEAFDASIIRQVAGNQFLMVAQDKVLETFAREKIPCVVLKGSSASAYYPKPELRVLGDIDLLVSKESLDKAGKSLLDLGYRQLESAAEHHVAFEGRGGHVELHFETTYLLDNASVQTVRPLMAGAVSAASQAAWGCYAFPVLSSERQAVFLLLHMQQHMKASGIGLRHLCDFVMYLAWLDPDAWARDVAPVLIRAGLFRFAQALAKTGVLWLGLPAAHVPWCLDVREDVCRALLTEFLRSGNFGVKDAGHRASAVLASDKSGQRISRFLPLTLIRNINLAARKHYPITRTFPLILPIFWVYLPMNYLWGEMKKGRKLQIKQTISASQERRKLFASLGIFDGE